MNYRATGWAYDLPLKGSRKPVLSALADMADESNSCYPGQDKIAHMTGLSTRTVRRALDDLEALGLIVREARRDRAGHRTSDRYVLDLEARLPDKLTGSEAASEEPPADDPYRPICHALPDTVSKPTGHSVPVTTSRTTRENHQSDMGSVSPVTNVPKGRRRAEPDRFEPDVIEYAKLLRIKNLPRVVRTIRKTIKTPVHPMGAMQLVNVLLDRANGNVHDVDAYIATCCRDTVTEVRHWWDTCDLDAYNHPTPTKEKAS